MTAPTTRETADHAELAACPFCGLTDSADNATQEAGVSVRPFRSPAGGTACRVECACGASGPSKREDWAATEAWNRRDPQSALLSEIAALRDYGRDVAKEAVEYRRQRDEAVGLLKQFHTRIMMERRCNSLGVNVAEPIMEKTRAFLANQGADQ